MVAVILSNLGRIFNRMQIRIEKKVTGDGESVK